MASPMNMPGTAIDLRWWWLERRWIFGIPAPIWYQNLALIEKIIDKHDLRPLPQEQLPGVPMADAPMTALADVSESAQRMPRIWPGPFPGGLRMPHLHFEGRVYPLDREQWRAFSGEVLQELRHRLEDTKVVSFTQLMELTEAVENL